MNQKFIVIILLMSFSEDMFIFISSFVFGYCIDYYSYNSFKPKNLKDEIIDFILRYNIKREIVNKKIRTNKNQCFYITLSKKIEEKFDDSSCSNFLAKVL